jgi:dTMP kinase
MFVVFEGGEGCGKSTQARLLAEEFTRRGIFCLLTREPGGTPLADDIRAVFKQVAAHGDTPTPLAELHLVMAARAQHVERVLAPALAVGKTIVCDRFLDSSYVYQGIRGGLSKAIIDASALPVLAGLVPTVTLILDVPSEAVLKRLHCRVRATEQGNSPALEDRLDAMEAPMHKIISEGFANLARSFAPYPNGTVPKRIVLDGQGSPEEVFARVFAVIFGSPQ